MIVYGEGTVIKRIPLWDGINSLRPTSSSKDWPIIRDFNEIHHPSEWEGHGSFDRAGASEFENAIGGFTEMEAIGDDFTWENGTIVQFTRSRLDRALGDAHWIARRAQTCLRLVLGIMSDHARLHIQLTRA